MECALQKSEMAREVWGITYEVVKTGLDRSSANTMIFAPSQTLGSIAPRSGLAHMYVIKVFR